METIIVMNDPKTAPSDPDKLVEAILKDGIDDYLKDADTANVLINMICDETDFPKYLVKPVFRIITPWVLKKSKTAGKNLLGSGQLTP
jgi:hypothetical protein